MTRSANRKAMDVSAAAYGQALRDGANYATAMQAAADAIGADLGTGKPATRTCAWCSVTADAAGMERINLGPPVACKDITACSARIEAQDIASGDLSKEA